MVCLFLFLLLTHRPFFKNHQDRRDAPRQAPYFLPRRQQKVRNTMGEQIHRVFSVALITISQNIRARCNGALSTVVLCN